MGHRVWKASFIRIAHCPFPITQFPLPNAHCPMPHAQLPIT
ncbi:hypothetical protein [Tolypothrix sp. VBCCA 56010]